MADQTGCDITTINPDNFQPSILTRASIYLSEGELKMYKTLWANTDASKMDPLV